MMLIRVLIFLLLATPSYALGVSQVRVNPGSVEVKHKGVWKEIVYADIDATLINLQNAQRIQDALQEILDERIKKNQLPQDDPDRSIDPNRANAFWEGNEVVYRNTLVTVFIENGLFNVSLQTVDYND